MLLKPLMGSSIAFRGWMNSDTMGFYYRKSVDLGPFRMNLSKSGVGYSVGGRGSRVGTTERGKKILPRPRPVGLDLWAVLRAGYRATSQPPFSSFSIPGTGVGYRKSGAGCLDPEESSPDIDRLRKLHAAMDAAVLTAYGWTDLLPRCTCEFLLDYEDEEDDEPAPGKRKKKKPWRYRWPDEVRDEVLARLLALNATRHAEEVATGTAPGMKAAKKTKPKKTEENFQLE
jgi:hypothetical protein